MCWLCGCNLDADEIRRQERRGNEDKLTRRGEQSPASQLGTVAAQSKPDQTGTLSLGSDSATTEMATTKTNGKMLVIEAARGLESSRGEANEWLFGGAEQQNIHLFESSPLLLLLFSISSFLAAPVLFVFAIVVAAAATEVGACASQLLPAHTRLV